MRKSCPVLVEREPLHDFPKSHSCGILLSKEAAHMNPNAEKLRQKYINTLPEGMTSGDIRRMREDDLLDIDYFFMKMTHWMTILVKKTFISSESHIVILSCTGRNLSNICSINFCLFYAPQTSEFPIKWKTSTSMADASVPLNSIQRLLSFVQFLLLTSLPPLCWRYDETMFWKTVNAYAIISSTSFWTSAPAS